MEKAKKELLDNTYQVFMRVGLESDDPNLLEGLVDQDVTGFGTAIDEKILGIEDFKQLMINQKTQSEGIDLTWRNEPVHCFISEDENTAVFAEDIYFNINTGEENLEMYLRFSIVLTYSKKQWKVVHWHGSKPEQVESEKDTWGIASWKEKAESLEKEIAARTADLMIKNKELAVEAALERVRAKTMAMHTTSELQQVIHAVHQELIKLEISILGGSFIVINSEIGDEIRCWGSGGTADTSDEVHIPFYNKPFYTDIIKGIKAGPGFFTEEFTQQEKQEFFTFLFQNEPWSNLDAKEKQAVISSPGGYTRSCAVFENTSIFIINQSGKPFSSDENDILKRFGKVFEQTYTRFLDLQKAETRARESQIEAALEKIRSRTMGMRSSDELPEVANLLFTEVRALGIHAWSCGYNILANDKKTATCCMSSEGTMQTPFELRLWGEASFDEMGDFIRSDRVMLVQELGGKALEEHYAYMKSFPDLKPTFDEIDRLGLSLPTYQINHLCKFNQGFILFITYEKVPDAHDIFKRFTKVFDQTYTRFLDLQKAEAQAREAQIETALERVRSRTLAMQKSDELAETAAILFQQLIQLGIEPNRLYIGIIKDNSSIAEFWTTEEDGTKISTAYTTDLLNNPSFKKMYESWRKKERSTVVDIQGQELKEYIEYLSSLHIPFKDGTKQTRRIQYLAYFSKGFIGMASPDEQPRESMEILERFASAFNLTFTRFNDLKKAEIRARDSQIETALERVRSRTMGMQQSEELGDVATVLFNEMNGLVDDLWTCGFVLCEENRKEDEWWLSMEDGFTRGFFLPNVGDFAHETLYEGWEKGESFRSVQLEGKELNDHYEWLMNIPIAKQIFVEMEASGIPRPKWQKLHAAYFKTGYLVIITEVPCAEEEIFKRFAQVFDLTYTRFLDLQQKEEQGKKLIEEKIRLERTLKDLQATQAQLIQSEKMASLGELTAGIAHEIQNPLNFVNNFSEVSGELVEEMNEELEKGDIEEAKFIAADLKENLSKINHHGKRADAIVKGMLEHSRTNKGEKSPTDLNALADEFVRLSYHGLRAKDKSFNADFKLELDPNLPKVNVVASDIGRVILNLVNNAFYACAERSRSTVNEKVKSTPQPSRNIGTGSEGGETYKPMVTVKTTVIKSPLGGLGVEISVQDNGSGIPDSIKEKIFQPFFTTKPTGSGTGLGLSLSYDIVKAHEGELKVKSEKGQGSSFIITLPTKLEKI